jgi:hypothetical protein
VSPDHDDGHHRAVTSSRDGAFESDDEIVERPGHAVFEGAAMGGLLGAVLGWVIAQVAKRRRSR